jgi:hypothetical protein
MLSSSQAQGVQRYTNIVSGRGFSYCRRNFFTRWNELRLRLGWTGARSYTDTMYHSHTDLLAHLRRTGVLKTKRVEEAMASVDRALFVPQGLAPYAVRSSKPFLPLFATCLSLLYV